MARKRIAQKRTGTGGDKVTDKRAELLRSEIDLSFTFVAVALTSYAAGKLDTARKAANDAQKKFKAAQRRLANIELSRDERRAAADRLKNLELVLATFEARDPGVFASRPSAETVRDE